MTLTTRRSRAQAYAEDTLGVQAIYKEIQEIEDSLVKLYPRRALAQQHIRERRMVIDMIVMELRIHERGLEPAMSATAFEAHLKVRQAESQPLQNSNTVLAQYENDLGVLESEIRTLEIQHRSRVARMQEISGYLNYLAASKTATSVGRLIADTVV